jgi:hypothetical protein
MSIDKIGNMDNVLISNYSQQHKVHKPTANADTSDVIERGPANAETTKISYPPFFPVGDTQSIYKK